MVDLASVEGKEVVIRVDISTLVVAAHHSGLVVTDASALAPHFARELNAEGMDEELFINKALDAALLRCAENDDPGISFKERNYEPR